MIKQIDRWDRNSGKLSWKKPCFMKIPIDLPFPGELKSNQQLNPSA